MGLTVYMLAVPCYHCGQLVHVLLRKTERHEWGTVQGGNKVTDQYIGEVYIGGFAMTMTDVEVASRLYYLYGS